MDYTDKKLSKYSSDPIFHMIFLGNHSHGMLIGKRKYNAPILYISASQNVSQIEYMERMACNL